MGNKLDERKMKSAVLARPNLKAFLLGAILIAVVQSFFANGFPPVMRVHAREPGNELQQLLKQAEGTPNSQLYTRISFCYEKQGEIKKALTYLRKAQIIAQFEDEND
jgi:hypothetical protein